MIRPRQLRNPRKPLPFGMEGYSRPSTGRISDALCAVAVGLVLAYLAAQGF